MGWNKVADAALTPDLTGDGKADLIARDPTLSALRIYEGDGKGGASSVVVRGGGWNAMRHVVPVGDRDGDGFNDLVAVTTSGVARFYPGDGRGWFRGSVEIGSGWNVLRTVTSVGDLTGDGRSDIVGVRASDGALLVLASLADGSSAAGRVVSWGWAQIDTVVGGGDLDGDANVGDLLGRESGGRMRTYYADSSQALSRLNYWGGGWDDLSQISSGADWSGDGRPDVLAVKPSVDGGQLVLYPGTGLRDLASLPVPSGISTAGADLVRLVGDVDGDGRADAIIRMLDGRLMAARGAGNGTFGAPFAIGRGWDLANMVEPAGDYTKDGVPDVLVRMKTGEARIYALNRSFGFTWQVHLESGWGAYTAATGVGSMNADFNGDLVTLRAKDGALLLYRGSGPGSTTDYVVLRTGETSLAQLVGIGDMNGDGTNDVLARDRDGRLWLYAGNGTGGLNSGRQPVRSPGPVGVVG
jgi:hypothetical protein